MQTDLLIALLDIEIEMCVFMFNNNFASNAGRR